MKICDLKVMRGPNYWSTWRKNLIILKLDLEELENLPTNKIEGFLDRLKKAIPSLYEHNCSEGEEGGFFKRVQQGTWMGHVVEHIALEIQTLAGMPCGYGRTRSANKKGVYHVVFSYEVEKAGLYAAEAAVNIAQTLANGEEYDITNDIEKLKYFKKRYHFGPSTLAIIKAAEQRNIPYRRLNLKSMLVFGYGNRQRKIQATITDATSNIAIETSCDKEKTKELLSQAYIPVPKGLLVYDTEELKKALSEVTFPVVIKPVDGNHGRGVTTNIKNIEQALSAFQLAKTISEEVIIEEFILGYDFRFLVVNYKLVAVAKRVPAMITGNGNSTIQELIDITNQHPDRGDDHENVLSKIIVDDTTRTILANENLTLDSVLADGQRIFLKHTANISTGGIAHDVTEFVHPYNIFLAERAARLLNLDICGIDFVARNIDTPITKEVGAIVEVNASPGLRMHLKPSKGIARNVAEPIIEMLFPEKNAARIPIVAITGTNGKTTTTRLVAHFAKQAGHTVGYTTTDGIYIGDYMIHKGDCTGPVSTETVLFDPTIDFAVLECARGGILRAGLGFDQCDISIITNVTEDHLGLEDINSIEEMADVKSVVAKSTSKNGYAILNADDDLVYDMRRDVDCNIALFSMYTNNERVRKHCKDGGLAAVIEEGYLVIYKGEWKIRIEKIPAIPLTFNGKAECMIKNVLPATLAAFIQKFSIETIRTALKTFIPSPSTTPGRMNLFHFKNYDFMVDYAHNIDSFLELGKFLSQTNASEKIGIIGAPGDRKDEDIFRIGQIAGKLFDQVIIRHDKDLRGRTPEELSELLIKGVKNINQHATIEIISDAEMAMQYAMSIAKQGAFIFISSELVYENIRFITKIKAEEEKSVAKITSLLQKVTYY